MEKSEYFRKCLMNNASGIVDFYDYFIENFVGEFWNKNIADTFFQRYKYKYIAKVNRKLKKVFSTSSVEDILNSICRDLHKEIFPLRF